MGPAPQAGSGPQILPPSPMPDPVDVVPTIAGLGPIEKRPGILGAWLQPQEQAMVRGFFPLQQLPSLLGVRQPSWREPWQWSSSITRVFLWQQPSTWTRAAALALQQHCKKSDTMACLFGGSQVLGQEPCCLNLQQHCRKRPGIMGIWLPLQEQAMMLGFFLWGCWGSRILGLTQALAATAGRLASWDKSL